MQNKTYYQMYEEMIDDVRKKETRPSLLLHACCGPCSSYVLESLSSIFDITCFYYNPNIYPEEEYVRRKEELERFLTNTNVSKFVEAPYNPKDYYTCVKGYEHLGERSERCKNCYLLRMREAGLYAKKHNFDYFTTTLSISPHKNSDWINEIGEALEKEIGVKYLYADFKKKNGYLRSLELSKEYDLYRQEYCGCVYSMLEMKERKEGQVNEDKKSHSR